MSDNNDTGKFELTEDDIQKLIKSPFEKKIDITKKIAEYYKGGGFTEEQMIAAAKIFGTLVKDTEVNIRKTLSEAIKDNPNVPKDVVIALAHDVQAVSLPVLEFSEVLTDADLIEIVNTSEDVEKQKSISKRNTVSEGLSEALIDTNNEDVVDTLLHNDGADVSEEGFEHIVENFGDKEEIMGAMIERENIPVSIAENLADKISQSLYSKLKERHTEAFAHMDDVVNKSRDVALMKVIGLRSTDTEYYQFGKLMEQLKISDDLAPIYALCMGNMNVFEVKVARLTQTPVFNIKQLISDETNKGFRVLYRRAGLPQDLYEATEVLIAALRDLGEEYRAQSKDANFTNLIASNLANNIMSRVDNTDSIKNLDYILSLVDHYANSGNPTDAPPVQ